MAWRIRLELDFEKTGSDCAHGNEKAAYLNDRNNNEIAARGLWREPFCRLILLPSVASNPHHAHWRRQRFDAVN
jgi:hypothetical protein